MASTPTVSVTLAPIRSRALLAALLILVPVAVAVTLLIVPFSTPMGGFWSDAQQFAATGHIRSVFTPCGYPALLGIGFRAGGLAGVVILQMLVYATTIAAAYRVLRLLAVEQGLAATASALLALHPDVVISLKKIWDTDITALFLMVLCGSLLALMRKRTGLAGVTVTGVLWGLSMTVRPNFPALILPIAFALWCASNHTHRVRMFFLQLVLLLAAAVATLAFVNSAVHGAFFLPQNGPYNLYAGDNAFTEQALRTSLNAEPSIYPSLRAQGFGRDVNVYDPQLHRYYVRQSLLFVRHHAGQAFKLVFLKLGTLLRPDTKIYSLASLAGTVKAVEALALPFWLVTLLVLRGGAWEAEDWLFVMFAVAYVGPFLLTNADPRFRIPLDFLVLTHALYRIARCAPVSRSQLRS